MKSGGVAAYFTDTLCQSMQMSIFGCALGEGSCLQKVIFKHPTPVYLQGVCVFVDVVNTLKKKKKV